MTVVIVAAITAVFLFLPYNEGFYQNFVKLFNRINNIASCLFLSSMVYTVFMPQKPKYDLEPIANDKKTIGQRISGIRKIKGFTQKELCEKIGINQSLLSDYENDKLRPSAEMIAHIAVALRVSTDQILGLEDIEFLKDKPSLKIMRRLKEIEELSPAEQKKVLQNIDLVIQGLKKP
jgi:transcriptional regulator with XRE-family HTH domain